MGSSRLGSKQDTVPIPLFKDGDYEPQDALDPVPLNGQSLDIGRYVLMPPQPDGQQFHAKILGHVHEYRKHLDKARNDNAQYKVLVGCPR
jgi:hypothetical protein